ncbi:MAG: sugar phosphate isomerase/epimerase [Candidatus Aenigmarchaeota archaeon]|nr:sugar phosphate isomerase/epimerase [Candidatus Aenigmarchaeota archaeon]
MVYFGNLTNPTVNILDEIEAIHKLGMDFVEIGMEGPEGMPEILMQKKDTIRKSLEKKGMFAIGHTSWYAELGTPHESVRKAWLSECKRFIDVATALRLEKITFHSHSRGMFMHHKRSKKRVLDNFVLSLRELVEYGTKSGVMVMLENATEKREIYNIKDFSYIVSRVTDLGVHIDIGHAFMHGRMKNVEKYINAFHSRLEHLHFHDNHGKFDEHLPIGKGRINYKRVVQLLKKKNYDKTITFEVFSKDRNMVRASANKIKVLWAMI